MKVYATCDERYEYYDLYEDKGHCREEIELTPEEWERYKLYASQDEFWQSKIHRLSEESSRQKKLINAKEGKPSIGF